MTAALSLVVQQLGIGACPQCLPHEQRMCPVWTHTAMARCTECEAMLVYRGNHADVCPAVAIARLSATCKAAEAMRNQREVQVRVQDYATRDQVAESDDDAGPTDAEEELRRMQRDPRMSGTRELHEAWLIVQREQADASGMF